MLLRAVAILALALMPFAQFAEGALFVSSDPMGAKVYLDGVELAGRTPLLLRDVAAGSHRLRIEKEAWMTKEAQVEVPATNAVDFGLSPVDPALHFEGESAVRVAGQSVDPADGSFSLKAGALTLQPGRDGIDVTPVFGRQRLLDGIRFALPLFIGLTGVLTAREIYAPRKSPFVIAPELAASTLIGGGLLGWDIALEAERKSFVEQYRVEARGPESLAIVAKMKFEAAGESLIQGNFESALSQFEAIARDYPDSPIAPRAIFECAGLKYTAGDREGAAEAFRSIVQDYPLVDLYDRSLKGLADCLSAEGDAAGALAQLDLLTYLGPGLTREEIRLYRQSILDLPPRPIAPSTVSPGSGADDQGKSP
jgi:hypothetical protein